MLIQVYLIRIGLDKIRQKYTNYKCAGTATMADKRFRTFLSRTQKNLQEDLRIHLACFPFFFPAIFLLPFWQIVNVIFMRVFILIWHQPFSFPGDSFAISLILLPNITLCIIRSLLWTSIDMTPSDQVTNQWNYKWRKYWHFEYFMITFLLEKQVRSQYLCKKWIHVIICVGIAV